MNYTIVPFLLLVALTCCTSRSIDVSGGKIQEIREEKPSTNEDAPFSLLAAEDEEARITWKDFLAKSSAFIKKYYGREESLSANENEERERNPEHSRTKIGFGRNEQMPESLSADEEERAWYSIAKFLAKVIPKVMSGVQMKKSK